MTQPKGEPLNKFMERFMPDPPKRKPNARPKLAAGYQEARQAAKGKK